MPTGYTAEVADGKVTDFRTFALRCARQFGACIMQRDEASDVAPRLVEPSDYNAKALAEATTELARLQAMTVEQAGIEADAEYARETQRDHEYRLKKRETRNRYEGMIWRVEKWNPPSEDHAELKRFMLTQLRESIDFDCNESYTTKPEHLSGEAWLTKKRGQAAKDIGYHTAEHAKEVERTNTRNAWISALYASLPNAVEVSQ